MERQNQESEVSGGVLPVIAFGLALSARVGVGVATTNVVGHIGGGVGLGLGIATYSLCQYMGGAY
ncbi:hypothetical protein N9L66_05085 [Porticoccaceae bacterium]|nr:hypothetical protein [Porticoccaceae bacterium]MDA8664317.1 hypothetical protein [Porticoccaceae bacterium]MDB2486520.1 hypothetical protein [Porticoccaceae bacterium]MDB2635521.1 hypothetical protein [Porticoccaceae bacterium]MDB2664272.1 hypothetical protein [Porticoccaceae bacterium]